MTKPEVIKEIDQLKAKLLKAGYKKSAFVLITLIATLNGADGEDNLVQNITYYLNDVLKVKDKSKDKSF